MLHILAVVDRLNLEMLLSHEARITRIKTTKKTRKKNFKNISKRRHKMDKLSRKKKHLINTYKAAN